MLKKKGSKKLKKEDALESHHFVKKSLDDDLDSSSQEPDLDYVSEQLVEIYKNQDGSLPDMTSFQKRKSQRTLRAFFTLLFSCLFLGCIIFAGFFFFAPKDQFEKDGVIVDVSGEENIISGELARFRIRYRNSESVDIKNTKIVVHYPKGFIFKESTLPPANEAKSEWTLGTLQSGQSGFFDIEGTLSGDFGSEDSLRVFLNYTPVNFSSEFQSATAFKVAFVEAPVNLSISGPSSVLAGQNVSLVVTLSPTKASSSLSNLVLVVEPGEGFVKKNSSPESDNFGTWKWTFANLDSEKNITINGLFSPSASREYSIKAKVLSTSSNGQTFVLAEKEYKVPFEEAEILGQFTVNGAGESLSVIPGEALLVEAAIKNNLPSNISNIRASVTFDAPSYQDKSILNWAALQDKNKNSIQGQQIGTDTRRGIIAWDKTHIAGLGNLAPQAELLFSFTLPLKSLEEAPLASFKEHRIIATFEVQYEKDGKKQTFASIPIEVIINSDLNLTTEIKKEKNLNNKDDFTISWNLLNTFHEVKNVEISGQIFGDVTWEAGDLSVAVGKLEFDPKEKKILWKIDTLPASANPVKASFSFVRNAFNSTQTQLISKLNITAKDSVTGKDILLLKSETPNSP